MRLPRGSFFAVRRDATVPTTVVVVTQVAATAATAATSSSDPTITVLTTITAGSGSTSSPALSTSPQASAITSTSLARTYASATTNSASTSSVSPSSSAFSKATATSLTSDTAITSLISPSSSSSTRLGLAIGIPIAVVSIFGLVVFILIYLRKRMENPEMPAFKAEKAEKAENSDKVPKIITEKQSVLSMYSSSDVEQGYGQRYDNRPPPIAAIEQKPTLLKRISRLMNVPESPLEFRSPVFLRRFHLNSTKNAGEGVNKPEKALPKSPLSHAYNASDDHTKQEFPEREIAPKSKVSESTYVVTKPYARRLGDELTVCIGEKVSIVDHNSDGWAMVKLAETGDVGVIPLMCIKKFMGK